MYFEYIPQEIRPKILKPRNTSEIAKNLQKKFAIFGRGLVMAIFQRVASVDRQTLRQRSEVFFHFLREIQFV